MPYNECKFVLLFKDYPRDSIYFSVLPQVKPSLPVWSYSFHEAPGIHFRFSNVPEDQDCIQHAARTFSEASFVCPHRSMINRSNLSEGCETCGSFSTANHYQEYQVRRVQFLNDMHHFFQRRCNKSTQADNIYLLTNSRFNNLFCRNHYAQVDNFVIVHP